MNITKSLEEIDKQIQLLDRLKEPLKDSLPRWHSRMLNIFSNFIVKEELDHFRQSDNKSWKEDKEQYRKLLKELYDNIEISPYGILIQNQNQEHNTFPIDNQNVKIESNKVFIIHGHDELTRLKVVRLVEKIGLQAIVLQEQPNESKTIIEKFEREASLASYAIAIFTPDDIGYPCNKPSKAKPRARQNVILELGFFTGILGRENICVLYKGNVEIPSDYLGVVYVPFDENGAWKVRLAKELKNSKLKVDLNNL